MTEAVHDMIYDSEDAENVVFRCRKVGCTPAPGGTIIAFNKPWVGSPSPIWLGPEDTPDESKLQRWAPSPDFQNYLGPCEGAD